MYKITLSVEGMSCGKCEEHVNNAIRKSFKVKSVTSSRTEKKTVIIAKEDIDASALGTVISGLGFKLTDVTSEPCEKKGLLSFLKK